ncbi:MAG: hypothetical protein ACTJGR_05335 [Pauljensenia sp.]
MPGFEVDHDEMDSLRALLLEVADTLLEGTSIPSNPGVAVLGLPVVSEAFDDFRAAATQRRTALGQWCLETAEDVNSSMQYFEATDAFWALAFRSDKHTYQ